jgi:hypothetical protein
MRDVVTIARSKPARWAGWVLAAVLGLAAAAVYGVALWRAPGWMHATTAQAAYNARVLVISVGGAIVVGTGLLYTARNYRLSRRGQVTDRFTVALERLGSSELYVRLGGVHALEHVMHDSADHHDDVIEVLTAFINNHTPRCDRKVWHPVTGSVPDPDLPLKPAPDIQAALTALGHRPYRPERRRIEVPRLHLTGATLAYANLGDVDLSGATLNDALLHFADLAYATLNGAGLARATLYGADLIYAQLNGADLTHARLNGADLTHADLAGANLTHAQLTGTDLTGTNLDGADLADADLGGANLTNADLNGADLNGAKWPEDSAVPEGWRRDDSKRLERVRPRQGGEPNW